jgi:hypothetical protein
MQKRKLAILIVVVLALALVFAACGKTETTTSSSVPTTSVAISTTTSVASPTTTSTTPAITVTTTSATPTPSITKTQEPAIAKIAAVALNSAEQGTELEVTISGSGFTGATAISFGDGITVKSFNVAGDAEMTADIAIAADAIIGVRDVSVTTPAGTSTLTGGFSVEQKQPVLRTVVWTNSDFNKLSHILTGVMGYEYTLKFHAGNKMEVISLVDFDSTLELRDGKLCFLNMPGVAWEDIYIGAYPYMKYERINQVMTADSLPEAILTTMFSPPEKSLPKIETMVVEEGKITLTYYSTTEGS